MQRQQQELRFRSADPPPEIAARDRIALMRGSLRLFSVIFLFSVLAASTHAKSLPFAVLVSADTEWRAVKPLFAGASLHQSPYGEYFFADVEHERVLFFHGGWGKVAAAGSTQYVIDQFHPARLINLGTCGVVEGRIRRFDIVAPEKAIIYDIAEAMGDSEEAIAHYTTSIKLPVQFPVPVVTTTMYSADRDLTPQGLRDMDRRFRPVAVDWESGAIAWVAQRNHTPLLILRGVSDLVSPETGEAQGNIELFEANAARIMRSLVNDLPKWIAELRGARQPDPEPRTSEAVKNLSFQNNGL